MPLSRDVVLPPPPTPTSSSLSNCPGSYLGKPGVCGSFHFYSSNPNSSGLLESCSLHSSSCTAGGVIFLNHSPSQPHALTPPGQQQNIYKPPTSVFLTSISLTSCLHVDYIPTSPNCSNARHLPAFSPVGHQPSFLFQLGTTLISKRLNSNATLSRQTPRPLHRMHYLSLVRCREHALWSSTPWVIVILIFATFSISTL